MPFVSTVHIDQALTNVSIAYTQLGLVADRLAPVIPVEKRSDVYFVYGKESFDKIDALVRPRGVAPEVTYTVSNSPFNAERRALRIMVTDAERRLADDPLRPEIDATETATARLQLDRERRIVSDLTSTSNITNNTTLSGTSQWSDYTNSTPLSDIRTARNTIRGAVVKEATDLTLGADVALTLADHPSIKDLIKYTHPDALSMSNLPTSIRGLRVNESSAQINTANDGATTTFGSVFGKNALVHYTAPGAGLRMLTLASTFEAPDDTTGARGFSVRRYRNEDSAGDWVEVSNTWTDVIIAAGAGYLYAAAIA